MGECHHCEASLDPKYKLTFYLSNRNLRDSVILSVKCDRFQVWIQEGTPGTTPTPGFEALLSILLLARYGSFTLHGTDILAARRFFKEVVGKNQDFILI